VVVVAVIGVVVVVIVVFLICLVTLTCQESLCEEKSRYPENRRSFNFIPVLRKKIQVT
jgi:amino acid permease